MFISEIMIISAKIDGYSRNLLSCLFFSGWFLLGVHFNHCRNTWQAWRPRYWIDKEFHQKVSRAWKQEKALAFCTHIDFFCIKIISVKKSNIQEQLRKKSVIRYLQLHLKYHLKKKLKTFLTLLFKLVNEFSAIIIHNSSDQPKNPFKIQKKTTKKR